LFGQPLSRPRQGLSKQAFEFPPRDPTSDRTRAGQFLSRSTQELSAARFQDKF